MAGLHDSEVIDLVAEQRDGAALLVIVKDGAWDAVTDPPALRAKLNTYAQFALDGGLVSHYPHLDGRPVTIRVDSSTSPPPAVIDVIAVAAERLRQYEISVISVLNPRL